MNRAVTERIETHLDPGGMLRSDVRRGEVSRETVTEYATAIVVMFDQIFRDEGGAGVTAQEMQTYVESLLDEANA